MKTIIKTLVFFFTISISAQSSIYQTVGEFKELKAYDLINVELIKSQENKIEITGKNASDVVIVNKNGVLKIRLNLEESFDGNKTDVKLYYTNFDVIDANEGAYVRSDDKINQYEVELRAQEGGFIELDLETKETVLKSVTGGIIELKGTTKHQNINIRTGGIFKGEGFKSEKTDLSINAGGEAYVNTSEILDIKIRAGGDVFIYGDPNKVNENRALGGRIKYMN